MFNLIANAAAAAAPAHDAGLSLMPAAMCVKEEGASPYGLVPALCEGGIVSQVTFLVLLIMFVGTLYILFTKLFEQNKVMNQGKAVDANFWRARRSPTALRSSKRTARTARSSKTACAPTKSITSSPTPSKPTTGCTARSSVRRTTSTRS